MDRSLRTQIKQTRGFQSVEEEAALNLWRTADLLAQEHAELLRGHDLTGTQYNVLRILRGAGPAGLAAGEIGERMVTRAPDVTRLLDRLERQGLVSRCRGTADRRVVTVTISEPGLRTLAELDAPVQQLHRRTLGHLGEERLRELTRLLEEARAG